MKRNNKYCLRNIGETYMLISSNDDIEEGRGDLILLNETSAFLWEQLERSCTIDDLVSAISNQYNVEEKIARQHVTDFISFLSENRCLDLE